ncbi:MAG: bifunctional ADP-heptose synthase [Bacteroidota bacterium]
MKSTIENFLDHCKSLKVMIIGDLMVDRYLWGKVSRISPEAPVPIVDVYREENRLGGAANVALNASALGAIPLLGGLVGEDRDGATLRRLAKELNFNPELITPSNKRRTTVKVRIIGNNQQVLRVDREDNFPAGPEEIQELLEAVLGKLSQADLVIMEDYDKGVFSPFFIQSVVHRAVELRIPICVDPKFRHFTAFSGVTLFKPNLKELNEGMKVNLEKTDHEGIRKAVLALRKQMPHKWSLITLSEEGMLWVDEQGGMRHFPAHYRDIVDVSGAGDTVITVISLALAAGLSPEVATMLANLAGGLVCEEVGVVPIDPNRLLREGSELRI